MLDFNSMSKLFLFLLFISGIDKFQSLQHDIWLIQPPSRNSERTSAQRLPEAMCPTHKPVENGKDVEIFCLAFLT